MSSWEEVATDVFRRRYEPYDVSVCVVRGDDGLLLVDTRASALQADEVLSDLDAFALPVRWVVNTHAHFDHTFGNQRFGASSPTPAAIYGHVRVPAHLERYEVPMLAAWQNDPDRVSTELDDVVITPPTQLVETHAQLDVGGRVVELVHLGRGHTDNDLLLHVPDAKAWLVGDLVEESGPPMYGTGSFPLEWPSTVQALVERLAPGTVVVPGHGESVDVAFAVEQQEQLQTVADVIRELYDASVPLEHAVAFGVDRWPFPLEGMATAVADGYSHLALRAGSSDERIGWSE